MRRWFPLSPSPFLIAALLFGGAGSALASTPDDFQHFVTSLKQEARAAGVPATVADRVLGQARFLENVIRLDRSQPESVITLGRYLSERLTTDRLDAGRNFARQHGAELQRAAQTYGVPAQFIVALIGIETNYGATVGRTDIVSSLATLAYEGRRADFFKTELMALLKIIASGQAPALPIKGSWAAASGRCQFMPTSYLKYAADGDGDGRKDIWGNWSDVFASTANYLKTEGWDSRFGWGYEVTASASVRQSVTDQTEMPRSQWEKIGVLPAVPTSEAATTPLRLVQPEGITGRAFLVTPNYFVVRHWNRSHKFAILVGLMSDSFAGVVRRARPSANGAQP